MSTLNVSRTLNLATVYPFPHPRFSPNLFHPPTYPSTYSLLFHLHDSLDLRKVTWSMSERGRVGGDGCVVTGLGKTFPPTIRVPNHPNLYLCLSVCKVLYVGLALPLPVLYSTSLMPFSPICLIRVLYFFPIVSLSHLHTEREKNPYHITTSDTTKLIPA